jgi:hypothetical protein
VAIRENEAKPPSVAATRENEANPTKPRAATPNAESR